MQYRNAFKIADNFTNKLKKEKPSIVDNVIFDKGRFLTDRIINEIKKPCKQLCSS